jgi:DNA repair protein RadD
LIFKGTDAEINTKGVHKRGGEFIAEELEKAAMEGILVPLAAEEIVARGQNREAWLCFCSGVDHALAVRDALRDLGVSAEELDGNTPKKERESLIRSFRAGAIKCLTLVNVLSIGFNAPDVDLIALLRPTESPLVHSASGARVPAIRN